MPCLPVLAILHSYSVQLRADLYGPWPSKTVYHDVRCTVNK